MSTKLAMRLCFHYDDEMLVPHLAYHRFLGVSKAYVYLDRHTPKTLAILKTFDFVECIEIDRLERERFSRVPYLQMACMNDALKRARKDGFDWLLSLDVDEFALPDDVHLSSSKAVASMRNGLLSMLDRVDPTFDVVQLAVKEVVPFYCNERFQFWRQHYFQGETPLVRELLNVESAEIRQCQEFLSHDVGKSIARTSALLQSHGPHGWVKDQNKDFPLVPLFLHPSVIHKGLIYHFFAFQNSHFLKKFKLATREKSLNANGEPIAFPRQCFKSASSKLSGSELVDYLHRYFYLRRTALEQLAQQRQIAYDDNVERILRYLNVLSPPGRLTQRLKELFNLFFSRKKVETARLCSDVDQNELTPSGETIYWDASMWPETLCSGFFLPELFEGRCLRWASPEAQLKLRIKPAKYRIALDFGRLVDEPRVQQVKIEFNETAIEASALSFLQGFLYFDVEQRDCVSPIQILKICCPAIDTSTWSAKDLRQLSIPLFGVEIVLKSRE